MTRILDADELVKAYDYGGEYVVPAGRPQTCE